MPTYEEWVAVPYCSDYQVSSLGRVRSLKNNTAIILRPGINKRNGYCYVCLWKDGESKTCSVHRLVIDAFYPERPDDYHSRHKNGIRHDNRASNLMYGDRSDNEMDKILHGTSNRGSRHGSSKLCEDDIRMIRKLCNEDGISHRKVAKMYGVCPQNIDFIILKRRWRHVV